jgi:hypothetical protein
MLKKEIIAVWFEVLTEYTKKVWGERRIF